MKLEDDLSLLHDTEMRNYVEEFAQDEKAFFVAFAQAFSKLSEKGQEDWLMSEI